MNSRLFPILRLRGDQCDERAIEWFPSATRGVLSGTTVARTARTTRLVLPRRRLNLGVRDAPAPRRWRRRRKRRCREPAHRLLLE
ncbi:hypothetical protein MTO96_024165 [Rhipicephalus appendiculatus]